MAQAKHSTDQTLRKAFDTAYETPSTLKRLYNAVPKRVKIVSIAVMLAAVTFVLFINLGFDIAERIEWANRPSFEQRREPPYGLADRSTPQIDMTLVGGRGIPVISVTDYEAIRQEMIEAELLAMGYTLPVEEEVAEPAAEPATADTPADASAPVDAPADAAPVDGETVDPAAAEAEAVIEEAPAPALPEIVIPESQILAVAYQRHLAPLNFDDRYFSVLPPTVDTYQRGFTLDSMLHPTINCLYMVDEETGTGCGMTYAPMFIEVGEYLSVDGERYRIVAQAYPTNEEAQVAMSEVLERSRGAGQVGDFAVLRSDRTNFMYAFANDNAAFAWRQMNWVYMVTGPKFSGMEAIVEALPF